MKLKLTLATATAMALLMGGAAWAADSNNYLTQSGDHNNASVNQTAGNGNQVGTAGESASQSGDYNELDVIQSNGSSLGVPGSYSLGVNQISDRNQLSVTQEDGSVQQVQQIGADGAVATTNQLTIVQGDTLGDVGITNRIGSVTQSYYGIGGGADRNTASISQNLVNDPGHFNSIGSASQNGVAQSLTVNQDGGWNTLTTSSQTGTNNTASVVQGSALGGHHNFTKLLSQNGSDNLAVLSITGSNNGGDTSGIARAAPGNHSATIHQLGDFNDAGLDISGNSNGYGIKQAGTGNIASGLSISGNNNQLGIGQYIGDYNLVTLADIGGDSNMVGLRQNGDSNKITGTAFGDSGTVDVEQHGNDNLTVFSQTGTGNSALAHSVGDRNKLNIQQDQSGAGTNSMVVTVTGDDNNNYPTSPALSGDALAAKLVAVADLGGGPSSFVQGDLFQSGGGNSLLVTVSASDKNAFATYQHGNGNSISHSITGGESNQAVIAQVGGSNSSTTAQIGSFNNLGVSQ